DLYLLAHNPLADGVANYSQLRENFAAIHAANPELLAAIPVGAGGIIAALAKAGSGNRVDIQLSLPDDISAAQTEIGGIIFAIPQGAAVPEALTKIAAAPILLGCAAPTSQNSEFSFTQGNTQWKLSWDEIEQLREEKFAQVYPLNKASEDSAAADALPTWAVELAEAQTEISESQAQSESLVAVADSTESTAAPTPLSVHVLLPVFPGTNSEYDTAQAFEAAGATTEFHVIRNLNSALLAADTTAFIEKLAKAEILAISGGFSLGDEPDGSAKFIANFLRVPEVAAAVKEFIARDGLVLGICNGFQALVKSGFLPYGDPDQLTENSPTLRHNAQLRHVSRIATTRVASVNSPWLSEFTPGQLHRVPVSHGEGRFSVNAELAQQLFANGQVAFQYVDHAGEPTLQAPENPNGSNYAIEGIISPCGRILGKMGHPERYRPGLMKNIPEIGIQDIFGNAVRYCQNRK
ncbi:MAG: phosphoribosylformylglycinamidine synthase subunit PurQ, partial [Arcanobacterium sp.]|nr:phosphoribosylformylglycinamidine synthase subunit PurQ [Arcanobacterium sp.]